jgi:hypothetical protein
MVMNVWPVGGFGSPLNTGTAVSGRSGMYNSTGAIRSDAGGEQTGMASDAGAAMVTSGRPERVAFHDPTMDLAAFSSGTVEFAEETGTGPA